MKYSLARLCVCFLGLLAVASLRAAPGAARHRIVIVSGEFEYSSMLTLKLLAEQLRQNPALDVTFLQRTAAEDIPGLDALQRADLLIMFIRRMTLPAAQLNLIRDYLQAGHPLVALRTSCHAFQNWKEFDHEVLGGNYQDHYAGTNHAVAHVEPAERGNPLLRDMPVEFVTRDSLYRMSPVAADARVLMFGTLENNAEAREPMTWTRTYHGGKIFFTSLGAPDDFQHDAFMKLLGHAIEWTLPAPAPLALQPIGALPAHAVTREELPFFLGFSSYVILDLRSAEAFARGHEKKAVNLDPSAADFETRFKVLDPTRNYLLYGEPAEATQRVAARLHENGFPVVYYLAAPYTR